MLSNFTHDAEQCNAADRKVGLQLIASPGATDWISHGQTRRIRTQAASLSDSLIRTRIQPSSTRLRMVLASARFFSSLFQDFFQSRM